MITLPDRNSEDYAIMDRYASELAKSIYDTTPENTFTVHMYIDDFFTEKLLEADLKRTIYS